VGQKEHVGTAAAGTETEMDYYRNKYANETRISDPNRSIGHRF
jgi:hypothetical protein